MNDLWERAYLNPNNVGDEELQILLNDRLAFVTDNLSTVSRHNLDETLFDLIMLFFDSLNEKRPIILKLWDSLDLNQKLDLKIPEEENYDTIGGFVAHVLGEIPKMGEKITYENLLFEVTQLEKHRILQLKLTINES